MPLAKAALLFKNKFSIAEFPFWELPKYLIHQFTFIQQPLIFSAGINS